MESLEVKKYKNDPRSFYSYLGRATVKDIIYQGTENLNRVLLDILFEIILEDGHPAELLIRLETPREEISVFIDKLIEAFRNPKHHPWDGDLFHKAVTGKTPREQS